MSISLTDHSYTSDDVMRMATDLMAQPVTAAKPIGQGANSRVYCVHSLSVNYVMKFYFQHPQDTRNRLATEFKSLGFLWSKGVRQIPQPLYAWPAQSCALYAFVEGQVPSTELSKEDIDVAVDFLKKLKDLTKTDASRKFDAASEAFFSAKDIVANLRKRLDRFKGQEESEEYVALQAYLQQDFLPLLDQVEVWAKAYLSSRNVGWDEYLPDLDQTLSSSDFGFHNALRTPEGIVFLDFEYFGWDDPAKTVSDFLWHPAMNLSEELKQRFVQKAQLIFGDDPYFQARLKAYFPLFGLKWCLIFLNEFVNVDLQRRGFAQAGAQDKKAVRLKQLAKAKALSDLIKGTYENFSYGN